jgi:hypothetical protein
MQAPETGTFFLGKKLGHRRLGVEIGIGWLTLLALVLDGQDLLALHRQGVGGHQGILSPTGSDDAGGFKIIILGRNTNDGDENDDPQTDASAAKESQVCLPPIMSIRLKFPAVIPGPDPEQGVYQI